MGLAARMLGPYRDGLVGIDKRVYLVVSTTLVAVAARMSVYTFLGIYFTREAGLSLALVGAAYLVESLLRGILAPFVGALSDRIGRRPVLLASALLSAIIMPAFLLVHSPLQLFLWAGALGAAMAGAWPTTSALLLDLTSPQQRQAVLGLNYTAISIGYTVGIVPAGYLLAYGFPVLAAASAGGFVLILLILVAFLRDLPPPVKFAGPRPSMFADLRRVPRDRAFVLLAALAVVFPFGVGLIATVAPLYAADTGLKESAIGLALAVNGPLLAFGAIPVAPWLTRHGPYRHLTFTAACLALSYVSLIWSGGFVSLVIAGVLFTAGELVFSSALPTAVAALAPRHARGAYQGAWALVHSVGFGSAVFFAGVLQPRIGWSGMWIVWMALTAVAALGLALARPRFRQLAEERAAQANRDATDVASG